MAEGLHLRHSTGLAMSPSFVSAAPAAVNVLGGQQSARTLHFFLTGALVLFLLVHVFMVFLAGFRSRMRAMITGRAAEPLERIAKRYGLIPPDSGGIYGPGETLTYAAQRLLTRHSLARGFSRSQISKNPFANEVAPLGEEFKRLQQGAFADWRLIVDGMVARPASFSLAELKSFPRRSHVTMIQCEEGWSYIAEWTGVPLSHVLERVGALPQVRYVVYRSIQPDWWESIDMADALHPQTLVSYEMNGGELRVGFGGPLRMRISRQLGYKSLKYITQLTMTDNIKQFGKGLGSAEPEGGYAWYAGA